MSIKEIYLDTETLNLSHEVPGGWSNIPAFGLAVGVTWDAEKQFRVWYEPDATRLIEEMSRFDQVVTFNGDRFDFKVLSRYGDVSQLYRRSFDLLVDLKEKLGHRVKLEALALATLGIGKTGEGTLAVTWWRAGEKEKVVSYCQQDVQLLIDLVQFARTNGYVRVPRRGKIQVDW